MQKPTGPTRGTAFDHIGFAVPNVPAMTTSWRPPVIRKPRAGSRRPDRRRQPPGTSAVYGRFAYFVGPDGAKSSWSPRPKMRHHLTHHIHFINKQYVEMQQWYMKALDATLRPGQTDFFIGADLPGVGYMLNFFRWEGDQRITHVGTAGRVVNHVGFEVKNLEAFCKALEAKGISSTRKYRKRDGGDEQHRHRDDGRPVGRLNRIDRGPRQIN